MSKFFFFLVLVAFVSCSVALGVNERIFLTSIKFWPTIII